MMYVMSGVTSMHRAIYWLTAIFTWVFLPFAIIVLAAVSSYLYVRDVIVYESEKDDSTNNFI